MATDSGNKVKNTQHTIFENLSNYEEVQYLYAVTIYLDV